MSYQVRAFEFVTRRHTLVLVTLHAIVIIVLAAWLPPGAWFVGDPGIKLIAARSAVAHPARPLESERPPVPAEAVHDYPQPFFVPHEDHTHAFTSALFPLLTAPFLWLFGLAGLYVLPAAGWLALAPLTVGLSKRLGSPASPTAIWIGMAALTPFVFYGLEFWEHAPAAALLLGSACLALGTPQRELGVRPPNNLRLAAAGFLGGVAILLRPETSWSFAALAVVVALRHQPRASSLKPLALLALGAVVGLAPQALFNWVHFGTLTPEHVSGNLAQLSGGWWEERQDFASIWLGVHRGWTRVAFALIVFSLVAGRLGGRRRWPLAIGMLGVAGFAFEIARGHELRENLWRALPLALMALLPPSQGSSARRMLWLLILLPLAGVLLTAPNDGGGQWGPRYLLGIVPPLVVLTFDTTRSFAAAVGRRTAWLFVAMVLACGMAVTRASFIELTDAKTFYAAMAAETAREARGRLVVTDVWWVPQVNAAVLDPSRVLWVDAPAKGARWLLTRSDSDVLLIANAETPPPIEEWTRGTCFRVISERRSEQGLLYLGLSCR